jgi:hypothetical protein
MTEDHEGPRGDERQELELAEALEAWARWNATVQRRRSGFCGWPSCPDHGWKR